MAHRLPDLPYPYDALEPHIDSKTMMIHHGKHHQAYVTNLNKALEGHPELQEKTALELILDLDAIPPSRASRASAPPSPSSPRTSRH